jgi:PTH1 family peptidyl-tRNA hydrolase
MVRICAFLGNVGREYERNRHNVAWQFLDASSASAGLSWSRKHRGRVAQAERGGARVWFLKPETFVNLSGESLRDLARFERVEPGEILVVHDELELPFGFVSLKKGGGLGGHNGLRSAASCLGTRDFLRLRIGIGRPDHDDVASYVLSDFNRAEAADLERSVFPFCDSILDSVLKDGFEAHEEAYRKMNALKPVD